MSAPENRQTPNDALGELSIEDATGRDLLEGDGASAPEGELLLAADSQGNSLTLLEEFAERRKRRVSPIEFALSALCAAASLAFAALLYFKTQ